MYCVKTHDDSYLLFEVTKLKWWIEGVADLAGINLSVLQNSFCEAVRR